MTASDDARARELEAARAGTLAGIRERVEAITGFEAIEHPNAGLTGRRELAELDTDGETWKLWDKNVPFSWKALTFIVHAPADIRFLLDVLAATERELASARAALGDIADMYDTVTTEYGYVDEWVEADGFHRCTTRAQAVLAANAEPTAPLATDAPAEGDA